MTTGQKELPAGWEWVKVGNVAHIKYGYTASADTSIQEPKFLRITDIQNDSVQWDSVPGCHIDDEVESEFLLQDRDIVFSRTGATTYPSPSA